MNRFNLMLVLAGAGFMVFGLVLTNLRAEDIDFLDARCITTIEPRTCGTVAQAVCKTHFDVDSGACDGTSECWNCDGITVLANKVCVNWPGYECTGQNVTIYNCGPTSDKRSGYCKIVQVGQNVYCFCEDMMYVQSCNGQGNFYSCDN
jgi:hypothetical protein